MEWSSFKGNMDQYKTLRVIKKRRKYSSHSIFYAGFLLCLVPSVVCDIEWTNHLTFDEIFNGTDFVQISRPYTLPLNSNNYQNSHSHSYHRQQFSELEDERRENINHSQNKLLVGFAGDPYRQSVTAEDYARGIREPQTSDYRSEGRGKRGVIHLYNMIQCATGCDPLSYKGYGCYCGFLGSGRPTDGIDRCCQIHDNCYEDIYCPIFTVYFQPYYWKCYHGQPLCALENHLSENKYINSCAARLCECDRRFAMCVQRYSCPKKPAFCHSSPLRFLQNLLMHG